MKKIYQTRDIDISINDGLIHIILTNRLGEEELIIYPSANGWFNFIDINNTQRTITSTGNCMRPTEEKNYNMLNTIISEINDFPEVVKEKIIEDIREISEKYKIANTITILE